MPKTMHITSGIIVGFLCLQVFHRVKKLLYYVIIIDIKKTFRWFEKGIRFSKKILKHPENCMVTGCQ